MKQEKIATGLLELKQQREQITESLAKIIPDEVAEIVDARLNTKTLEEIVNMTPQELLEFNMLDNERVIIAPPELNDADKEYEFVRDYIVFIKKSNDFIEQIDKSVEEFNKIMEETNTKLSELTDKDSDINVVTLTRSRLEKAIELETDDNKKKHLIDSLVAFNDSFNLIRLIELYTQISTENLKKEAKTDGGKIYKNYNKARKELGLKFDLVTLGDFEKTCLPEEYHDRNNLFVVICMKYISKLTHHRGAERGTDGLFAAQLSSNVALCMKDKLPESDREVFLDSVKNLLDMFK